MRKQLLLALVLCFSLPWLGSKALAQQYVCGFDEYRAEVMARNPSLQVEEQRAEQAYQQFLANGPISGQRVVKTIPCVVHVIQSSANIVLTDAEIQTQIDVMNEDFRKIAGTNGDGSGVDTEYQFCLATIDPNGCPTTGINRIINPALASHDNQDEALLKGLIQWDPDMYMNIWVPKEITSSSANGSIIGYATLPIWLPGQPHLDGIVVHSEYFGRNSNPQYLGRTATHEAGHWLGLFHPFQDGCNGATASTCATAGDRVCDTPQAAAANFGCPNINSCTDSPVDLPDLIANYMDYANGNCQDMFTQGQKDRMDFFYNQYRSGLSTPANLAATGCDGTVSSGCAPSASFSADVRTICEGQTVTFSDLSSGPATGWTWTFQGGTPASSTSQNPTVTWAQEGTYNVTLQVTNGNGIDTKTESSFITVQEIQQPPLQEGFENILFLPTYWYTENLGDLLNWRKSGEASYSGTFSLKIELYDANNSGAWYNLNTAAYDLSGMSAATLSFEYSYKRYTAFNNIDTLQIRASSDCGATWSSLWQKAGTQLATVGGNAISSKWIPTDTSQWEHVEIPVDSFAGNSSVRFQLRAISGGGQNIWVDDINLSTVVGVENPLADQLQVDVYPNPFNEAPRIAYSLSYPADLTFTLLDLQGRAIFDYSTGPQGAGEYQLDLNQDLYDRLPAGVYFLRASAEAGQVTQKLIKMNR